VEIGNRTVAADVGEEFSVPAEEAHRVHCTGSEPGRILQVAFGYSSEDDRLLVDGSDDDDEW
jgi:mannose-6-phosphate isomerase-like protein (cupin superfamily)